MYNRLLAHLHANRRADTTPEHYETLLMNVRRSMRSRFDVPAISWPHLVLDRGVIDSYARLDSQTVGVVIAEAVADPDCRIMVSPLVYLGATVRTYGTRRHGRLLRLFASADGPSAESAINVPTLEPEHIPAIAAIADDRPDVAHTALIALQHRCVIATTDPGAYHRIGYLRTLDVR